MLSNKGEIIIKKITEKRSRVLGWPNLCHFCASALYACVFEMQIPKLLNNSLIVITQCIDHVPSNVTALTTVFQSEIRT